MVVMAIRMMAKRLWETVLVHSYMEQKPVDSNVDEYARSDRMSWSSESQSATEDNDYRIIEEVLQEKLSEEESVNDDNDDDDEDKDEENDEEEMDIDNMEIEEINRRYRCSAYNSISEHILSERNIRRSKKCI